MNRRYPLDEAATPSRGVCSVVAAVENCSPFALRPFADVTAPDALDTLLTGNTETEQISFSTAGPTYRSRRRRSSDGLTERTASDTGLSRPPDDRPLHHPDSAPGPQRWRTRRKHTLLVPVLSGAVPVCTRSRDARPHSDVGIRPGRRSLTFGPSVTTRSRRG